MGLGEFQLIDRFFRRPPARADVALGVGDDCALLRGRGDRLLAVSIDSLNVGVHFPLATAAADIGYKALAVGLSDLAAMGAEPAWATLAISLPRPDPDWLQGFAEGFGGLAGEYAVDLVGGDTVRGPLAVTVQVHGWVEADRVLRRDAARAGDLVCVSGDLGGAALALQRLEQAPDPALLQRLNRPRPRIELGRALGGLAHACIDVSDGLAGDLGHILRASGVGAEIRADRLPLHPALRAEPADSAWPLALRGGDDYELCFTLAESALPQLYQRLGNSALTITTIGRIEAEPGLRIRGPDGTALDLAGGHDHFAGRDP